jgi:hypothetical protein
VGHLRLRALATVNDSHLYKDVLEECEWFNSRGRFIGQPVPRHRTAVDKYNQRESESARGAGLSAIPICDKQMRR